MSRWKMTSSRGPISWGLALLLVANLSPLAQAASRWEVAYLSGSYQLRVDLIDIDQGDFLFRFNKRTLPPQPIEMQDATITRVLGGWELSGSISSGTIDIGLGGIRFTAGDTMKIHVSRFTTDITVTLENDDAEFSTVLRLYRVGDQIVEIS